MVNRILELKTDVGANGTDVELGRETPREGKVFEVQELYARTESEGELTIEIDERALIDEVDTQAFPTVSERLVVNYQIQAGTDIVALGTDESGGNNEMAVYLVVDEVDAGA